MLMFPDHLLFSSVLNETRYVQVDDHYSVFLNMKKDTRKADRKTA